MYVNWLKPTRYNLYAATQTTRLVCASWRKWDQRRQEEADKTTVTQAALVACVNIPRRSCCPWLLAGDLQESPVQFAWCAPLTCPRTAGMLPVAFPHSDLVFSPEYRHAHETHMVNLKLFHVYVFNFSHQCDTVVLRHSHIIDWLIDWLIDWSFNSVKSNRKSHSVYRRVFNCVFKPTWRTFQANFTTTQFETTEPYYSFL